MNNEITLNEWKNQWRRFELITDDEERLKELKSVLDKANLTRYELAVILAGMRILPSLGFEYFQRFEKA